MALASRFEQVEPVAERPVELGGTVPGHVQAGAPGRAILGERGHQDETAGRHAAPHLPDVPSAIRGVREEVEHGTVVP